MRIYAKLIILSLSLSIIPLIVVVALFLFNIQKELKTEITDRLTAVSELKKNKLETFFKSRHEDLKAIQGSLDVQMDLPTLEEFDRDRYSFAYSKAKWQLNDELHAFMDSYGYANILLLDKKGKVVFVANQAYGKLYFDRVIFNAGALARAQSPKGYIGGPVATGDWKYPYILYMMGQARDTQGAFTGYIALVIDMNLIYGFISDNTGLGSTGETFLLKKMPDEKYLFISPLLYDPQALLNKRQKVISQTVDYRGRQVLEVWKPIGSLGWEMVTKIDKREVFASISNIRTLFFTVCLLIGLVIVLGCILFAEGILNQIQKLQAMTLHDPLTGVLNRRGLQEVLAKTFAMSKRMGISPQVMLIDLDNFKQVNDRHGHGVGDAILTAVGDKLSQTVRETDSIARVGGDEFMVLLLDSRQADAVKVADKIRMAVGQTSAGVSFGEAVKTTCSIGIVPLGEKPVSIDELLQRLHLSLHLCKTEGKNRIAYQGQPVDTDLKSTDAGRFKEILASGRNFYAASQPIFDLRTNARVGHEMLSRLDYDGYSSPDTFLFYARHADILGVVDYACLKACLAAVKNATGPQKVYINMFPSTLAEVPTERLLKDFACAGENISFCLEINEQQILGDPFYLMPVIKRLKEAGIKIALDDYGFGHSCIETLVLLEPDIVKVDRKLIKGIAQDARKSNSLKCLLKIIDSCRATVVAEGIENEEDLEVLRELGVVYGQGYLWGKPESPPCFA